MRRGTGGMVLLMALLVLPSGDLLAQERWVYRWSSGSWDRALSIAMGSDGNLHAAGFSWGGGFRYYFTVISLTPSGAERWFYRYGPGDGWDQANSIVAGTDGNLYAAGDSQPLTASIDFIVVSLTPSGDERWAYRYNGPGDDEDRAYSIVMGTDGNLYVAGYSYGMGTLSDFTIISLDTSGAERWVYCYDGPAHSLDAAGSIATGSDGNLYSAGYSQGTGPGSDFIVISLTPSGEERWVYRYNGPGDFWDMPYSIVVGADTNIYAAGYSQGMGTDRDFTVVSLTPSGEERWVYRYNGSANHWDAANSVVMGADDNLYAAGYGEDTLTGSDFIVIGLAPDVRDVGIACVDEPSDTVACDDTVLVSATVCNYGRTVETFDVEATIDSAEVGVYADTQTVMGLLPDSCRSVSFADWPVPPVHGVSYTVTVTSLLASDINPANDTASKGTLAWCPPGIEEANDQLPMTKSQLLQNCPNPFFRDTHIAYSVWPMAETGDAISHKPLAVSLRVYDASGGLVKTLVDESKEPGVYASTWDGRNESGEKVGSGVYLYRLRVGHPALSEAETPGTSRGELFTGTKKAVVLR